MQKTFNSVLRAVMSMGCVVACTMFNTGCHDDDHACPECEAAFEDEKKVNTIKHFDEDNVLQASYYFYYTNNLVDSIMKASYPGASARVAATDSITEVLHVFYASGECIPSYYELRKYETGMPVSMEKGIMSRSGDVITNKHLAYYDDIMFLAVNETAEIDYNYNVSNRVTGRSGTDYGILVYPNLYGNENYYTYSGNNISEVSAWKEQAGYDLDKTFDANPNPFNIQGGILYYLNLIAYTDEEHFETISQDENNVTQIVFGGTDTSNSQVTITYTFTYSYDMDSYPTQVGIYELYEDYIYGDHTEDHGTYYFTYY